MGTPVRDEDLSGWPVTLNYTGGNVTSIVVAAEDKSGSPVTYTCTLTYVAGLVSTVSEWVKS